jgi:hypothetical protein
MDANAAAVAWNIFFRTITGAAGLAAGLLALWIPLIAYLDESIESASAQRYGFQPSYWGFIGYWLTVLIFAGFAALISYTLLRFCLRRQKAN